MFFREVENLLFTAACTNTSSFVKMFFPLFALTQCLRTPHGSVCMCREPPLTAKRGLIWKIIVISRSNDRAWRVKKGGRERETIRDSIWRAIKICKISLNSWLYACCAFLKLSFSNKLPAPRSSSVELGRLLWFELSLRLLGNLILCFFASTNFLFSPQHCKYFIA